MVTGLIQQVYMHHVMPNFITKADKGYNKHLEFILKWHPAMVWMSGLCLFVVQDGMAGMAFS